MWICAIALSNAIARHRKKRYEPGKLLAGSLHHWPFTAGVMINFAPDECGAYGALRASPVHGTRSYSSRVETQTIVPKDGDQRPQCVLSVNKKRLCHAGERVAKAESYNERQKMGRKDQHIQDRIYALDIWLLCDTLASHPQFVHLRVFGRAAIWCRGGNGCRMALEIRPGEPSAVGRVNTRPAASRTPPGGQNA
jgi:hypothetical protein